MASSNILSEKQKVFLDYLIKFTKGNHREIPPIQEVSRELGLSTASLREQMELAKNLGFISAKPRKGVEILPYQFTPAASKSLYYAVNIDDAYFFQYSELRTHVEKAFFLESAKLLDKEDLARIQRLVDQAFEKLNGNPVRIPHEEHRSYHLSFYAHSENVFLKGVLEAYWDVYEHMGLNLYADLSYLKNVWAYHEKILSLTKSGKFDEAYRMLGTHMEFIYQREDT